MAQQNTSEEVDLGYLFQSVGGFFKKLVKLLFLVITFFKKYILIVLGLIILGVLLGYFLDLRTKKVYENRLIVIPNFESVEYLYDKTDEINFKLQFRDSSYLRDIFGNDYHRIKKIEIEPIVDIYNFTTKSRENIDVFRILFENQNMKEFVDDMTTSKQYKYQKLKVFIRGKNSKGLIDSLMNFYNRNEHFKDYQEIYIQNTARRLAETDKMLKQADSVIDAISSVSKSSNPNPPVYASFNNDFFSIFEYKETLLISKLDLLKKSKDEGSIIKAVSINYNMLEGGFATMKNVYKVPVLLLILFSFLFLLLFIYRKMKEIARG